MTDNTTVPDEGASKIVADDDLKALLDSERKKAADEARKEAETKFQEERQQRERADEGRRAAEARAAEAERKASESTRGHATEIDARFRAEEEAITGQIAAAESDAERLETQIADLYAEGKFADATKMSRQLASSMAKVENLSSRKTMLESEKTRVRAIATAAAADPTSNLTPASRDWVSRHPRYLNDDSYRQAVWAADRLAKHRGVVPDTEGYFKFVEEQLGERQPEPVKETKEPTKETKEPEPVTDDDKTKARTASVAPVQRRAQTSEMNHGGDGRIELSPDEKEHADISMPDIPQGDYQVDVKDKDGNTVKEMRPGRYRLYHQRRERLSGDGRFITRH